MTKPPEGYNCEIIGFTNLKDKASDRMPVPTNKTTTPLEDRITDHSNTVRIPFGGPNVPKGN